MHSVIIAGGGPTGMMLAGELALAGVDVAIVERRADRELLGSRAGGLHARTIEVLDQRGIAERFLEEGQITQTAGFAGVKLDISDFPTRHPYGLALWQKHIERILAGWVDELPVTVYRGREVTGFTQDDAGVDVELAGGESLRAEYLVGCDGGRSVVRKAAGIEFPGWDPTTSNLIAEAEMAEQPELGIRRDAVGIHGIGRVEYEIRDGEVIYADSGPVRVTVTEAEPGATGEPTLRELSEGLIAVYGTDYGIHSPTYISRFTDMTRQAAAYRKGRVLLAGDAAHVHAPDGGQGLNTGVQDAVNLGWKLAQVVNGTSPDSLLDTYHAERHPVAARVLRTTMASVALRRADERTKALQETIAELLEIERGAHALRRADVRPGHPLRPRRGPPAARPADARSRARRRRRAAARLSPAARGAAGAARPRPTRRARRRAVGRSGPEGRGGVRRRVGAPGHRRRQRAHRRPDPARRLRRLGRRGRRRRPRGRPRRLVRAGDAVNDDEPPRGRLVSEEPAATYSPGPAKAKYHRRCGA